MKNLSLLTFLIVLAIIPGCAINSNKAPGSAYEDTVEQYGNTIGNIANDSFAVKHDNWIYFSNEEDNGYIFKLHVDGSRLIQINSNNSKYLNLYGDWIYFSNLDSRNHLYRINLDGSGETALTFGAAGNIRAENVLIVDEWLYYKNLDDEGRVYRLSLNDEELELVTEESVDQFFTDNIWVYFINSYDVNTKKIYKTQIGSNATTQLNDHHSRYLNISGDWIYYTGQHSAFLEPSYIYKMRTDGSENTLVYQVDASDLNVSDGWIYFSNWEDNHKLYKAHIDGTDLTPLTADHVQAINIVDDRIIYISRYEEKAIYKVRTDGSEKLRSDSTGHISGDGNSSQYNGWIYYTDYDDDNSNIHDINYTFIYKMKPDGSSKTKITERGFYSIKNLNVYEGWIYFINYLGGIEKRIYRIRIDGSDYSMVNWFHQDEACCLTVVNDWMYYINTNGIYKMRIDGRERKVIVSDSNAYNLKVSDEWIYYVSEENKGKKQINLTDLEGNHLIIKN